MVILRKSKHFSVLPPSLPIAAQSKAMFFIILEIIMKEKFAKEKVFEKFGLSPVPTMGILGQLQPISLLQFIDQIIHQNIISKRTGEVMHSRLDMRSN